MKHTKIYRSYFVILCFFLGTLISIAQTVTIEWSAESYLVALNDVDVEIESHLTKQDTTFTWEQIGYNNSDTNLFTVTSTAGNWDSQNNLGELTYELTTEDSSANLTLTGTTDGITLTLLVHGLNGSPNENYTFYIETLTNL